ncbi:hypothetical protein UA08_01254 [Talaromyces atroroseus]|uniref:NADP-dependent oxidoreductase domain-containing protein n=1 Tax=Talaromyces atroroseus TaxID=1441469 RepID=A0A1Q5QB22_TALAT|nr:hypothetical protein UA08_01254 [Talaromyces atroroseus]OKL63120.1 hypothetical protein UA08_01254 [Talaromyces atroroseus]
MTTEPQNLSNQDSWVSKLSSGLRHPALIYGTAFKDEQTGPLTELALRTGFRAFDTANYPSAYDEAAIGEILLRASANGLKREEVLVCKNTQAIIDPKRADKERFQIQTKFTPVWAHAEGKLPYSTDQPLEAQVRESIELSFQNLKTDYIDIMMLHVPFDDDADNLVAWKVFETYVPQRIGVLGVSNFDLPALEKLYEASTIKPEVVQNRFQGSNGYDAELRDYLGQKGIVYQAFSVLKSSEEIIMSDLVARFSEQFDVPKEVGFYLLVIGLGNVSIVDGTTNKEHMQIDLKKVTEILGSRLAVEAMQVYMDDFKSLLSEASKTVM